MPATASLQLLGLAVFGIAAGLYLLARGLLAYARAARIATAVTGPASGIAAGEAAVTGTVVPGPNHLVSPLQGVPCVHYRSRIEQHEGDSTRTVYDSSQSVSFRVEDASGSVLVFPAGAEWSVEERLHESGWGGDLPPSVATRSDGPVVATAQTREAQIAELLTVRAPGRSADEDGSALALAGSFLGAGLAAGRKEYREERLEPGETVTVIGTAVPYADVDDVLLTGDVDLADPMADPEIAADLAAARAAGLLESSAEEAWGNAAIPGFGIGAPTREPELDPEVPRPAAAPVLGPAAAASIGQMGAATAVGAAVPAVFLATAGAPASAGGSGADPGTSPDAALDGGVSPGSVRRDSESSGEPYDVAPDELVLASSRDTRLRIVTGTPVQAEDRERGVFWLGLGGGAIAVASTGLLVLLLTGSL